MSDRACVGLAGPARAGPRRGQAWPASSGLRALPGAHAEPSAFSPCTTPLEAARRAHLATTTRTKSTCGDRKGPFPRCDTARHQAPLMSRASGEAPRAASRHGAVPRWASHDVKADARRVPIPFGNRLSLYCAVFYGNHHRREPCFHTGGAL